MSQYIGIFYTFSDRLRPHIKSCQLQEYQPSGAFTRWLFISGTQLVIYMGRTSELTNHQPLQQEATMKASDKIQVILKSLIPVAVYFGFITFAFVLNSVNVA